MRTRGHVELVLGSFAEVGLDRFEGFLVSAKVHEHLGLDVGGACVVRGVDAGLSDVLKRGLVFAATGECDGVLGARVRVAGDLLADGAEHLGAAVVLVDVAKRLGVDEQDLGHLLGELDDGHQGLDGLVRAAVDEKVMRPGAEGIDLLWSGFGGWWHGWFL